MIGSNAAGTNGGIGRAKKKVLRHADQPPKLKDPKVDMNEQTISKESNAKVSYKETLIGMGADLIGMSFSCKMVILQKRWWTKSHL